MQDTKLKSRQARIIGLAVFMESRDLRLARPSWRQRFTEQYASEKDARIAAYVWEKKGIALLAGDMGTARKQHRDIAAVETQQEFRL